MANNRKKPKFQAKPTLRRTAPPPGYYEIVLLDALAVKKKFLQQWKRKQRELEKQTAAWAKYCEEERPAFERWMHMTFGPRLADLRSCHEKIREKTLIISQIEELSHYTGTSARRLYQRMKKQVQKGTSLLDAIFSYRQELQEEEQKRYGSPYDNDLDEDDEDFEDSEEIDDFIKSLDDLFNISEDDEDHEEKCRKPAALRPEEHRTRIRNIYRNLCLKLHPDSGGKFNAETEQLWHQVQQAYEQKDLEQLETIQAGLEIKIDPLSPRVTCSQLLELCENAEVRLYSLKQQIRAEKNDPAWNFRSWTEKQRKRAIAELKEQFDEEHRQMEYEMQHLTKVIAKWEKTY